MDRTNPKDRRIPDLHLHATAAAEERDERDREEERELFLQAVEGLEGDVLRSKFSMAPGLRKKRVKPDNEGHAEYLDHRRKETESETFLKAMEQLQVDTEALSHKGDHEPVQQPKKELTEQQRAKLVRRGKIEPEAVIDLHGMTRNEALEAVRGFLVASANEALKVVKIITGKGRHSEREPVIKATVLSYVNGKGRSLIQSSYYPPPRDGGEGALYVFLK